MAISQGKRSSSVFRWYPDHEHQVYSDVYKAFKEQLIEALLDNPEGVTLPLNLGWLKIIGVKNSAIDRDKMRKVWPDKEVRYTIPYKLRYDVNATEGRVFTARWYSHTIGQFEDNSTKAFLNSEIYAFKANRILRAAMNKRITEERWGDYHFESTHRAPRIKEGRGRPKKQKPENNQECQPDDM